MRVGCGWSQRFARDDDDERRKGCQDASPALRYVKAKLTELTCVLSCEFVVGEDDDSSGLEDAGDVVEGGKARRAIVEIVKAEIGDDDVEGGVGKRHLGGRLADEGATFGDAFEIEIVQRGGFGVAGEIGGGPDVDAGGVAAGVEALCGSYEEKAASTAYVENLLIAAPVVEGEHEVAMMKLSDLDVEEVKEGLDEKKASGPEEGSGDEPDGAKIERRWKKKAQQKAERAEEKEVAEDCGRVDAVVGLCHCRMGGRSIHSY
jgi:hypothetical protein